MGRISIWLFADDVNLLGDNIDTIKKNTETLTDASKEISHEINVEKTTYTLLSCHQSPGQNQDSKIGNRSFENVSQFKYLAKLNSDNACYYSVQDLLSSRLLSKNVK
jgi:hypothetical protein